jgi:hypothetical protein
MNGEGGKMAAIYKLEIPNLKFERNPKLEDPTSKRR